MRSVKFPVVLLLMIIIISSCGKIEKLPPEPSIKFTSFEIFDSIDILGILIKEADLNSISRMGMEISDCLHHE